MSRDSERVHPEITKLPLLPKEGARELVPMTHQGLSIRKARPSAEHRTALLKDDTFRLYWLSRLLAQLGQNALLYALLVIVVDRTDASFYNSLFVVCAILPSLAFGLPAGVVVDSVPRRPLLLILNLFRFSFVLALVAQDPSLPGIFAATLGLWVIHQFYAPAEASLLASLVPRSRLPAAQAMANLALTIAQGLGLVLLAPLLLKTAGPSALFALCGAFFVLAALCVGLLPPIEDHLRSSPFLHRPRSVREALSGGWRIARNDHVIYEVLTDDVLVGIGGSALVVITPLYLKGVLDTAAENTVFVFAPAALGLVFGLRVSPALGRFIGPRRAATSGLMLFAACIAAFGFLIPLYTFLTHTLRVPIDSLASWLHLTPLVLLVMVMSIPAGFATSVVSVCARSVLLARTPPAARGQVIATQSLIQNIGALIPTLLAGVAADLVGVERVAIAIAALLAAGAIAALTKYRPAPLPAPAS
jgi:MFS family permease